MLIRFFLRLKRDERLLCKITKKVIYESLHPVTSAAAAKDRVSVNAVDFLHIN